MAYLDTTTRTTKTPASDQFQQLGRTSSLFGVFMGFVKRADDVQKNGRLQVWIPDFGSGPDEEQSWITVNYCSPFAGATNVDTIGKTDIQQFEATQTSYGMWMIPPDINNTVLVMFINGDPSKGIWIGCLFNQYMNNMVPGMASSAGNYQYPGKKIPVAEYNKWDTSITQPDRAIKPYQATKFKGLGNQGLITDPRRGISDTSARRESPSQVFGIITPGPVIKKDGDANKIRRKGGSSFIMDDAEASEYIQLTTKSGAQININETDGFIYLINRDGTAWVQMDQAGNIDIFGATNISMRAQRDFNIRADRNINIEAGQNIFMKASKDTKEGTTTFTYNVNNVPKTSTIPEWAFVGAGLGDGGNIVLQSLNNLQSTSQKGVFITTVDDDFNLKIGNTLNVTTTNGGQNFSSKQGIKMTTDAAFDLAVTGNIRVGANGVLSATGSSINMCADGGVGIKAAVLVTSITSGSPPGADAPMSANPARPAEVKPLNNKINILATWKDPESKFKRNSKSIQTTVSRYPTYEPCPEHESFALSSVAGFTPLMTPDDKTYQGSGGKGNSANAPPAASVDTGSTNTSVKGDPVKSNSISLDINTSALRNQLILHEGNKNVCYADSLGLVTGGIGHLIRSNETALFPLGTPLSSTQIESWYTQDSSSAIKIAQELIGDTWGSLSDVRKRAVADLAYNLGKARLSKFTNFISSIKAEKFSQAGLDLKDSKWFTQVGKRGPNICTMISQNVDPTGSDKKG